MIKGAIKITLNYNGGIVIRKHFQNSFFLGKNENGEGRKKSEQIQVVHSTQQEHKRRMHGYHST